MSSYGLISCGSRSLIILSKLPSLTSTTQQLLLMSPPHLHHHHHHRHASTRSGWFGRLSTPKPFGFGAKTPPPPTTTTTSPELTPAAQIAADGRTLPAAAAASSSTPPPLPPDTPRLTRLRIAFVTYWKGILREYQNVIVEAGQDAKTKPTLTTFYLALLAGAIYLLSSNPTEESFFAQFTTKREELDLVGPPIRSPRSEAYVRSLTQLHMRGQLRYWNLQLFSIVWRHDADSSLGLYEAQCDYLKPLWSEIVRERLIDVGVANKWWKSEAAMIDYDINEEEWRRSSGGPGGVACLVGVGVTGTAAAPSNA